MTKTRRQSKSCHGAWPRVPPFNGKDRLDGENDNRASFTPPDGLPDRRLSFRGDGASVGAPNPNVLAVASRHVQSRGTVCDKLVRATARGHLFCIGEH